MKRLRVTSQRVIAAALVVIAVALVWQTVRQELGWWGYAGWFGYAPLGGDIGIETEVIATEVEVTDLRTVNGDGREPVGIDLAAGLWIIELTQPRQPADAADRIGVHLDHRRGGIGWETQYPAIVRAGPGYEDADLGVPAGPVNLSVDTDGLWTVLFTPVPDP